MRTLLLLKRLSACLGNPGTGVQTPTIKTLTRSFSTHHPTVPLHRRWVGWACVPNAQRIETTFFSPSNNNICCCCFVFYTVLQTISVSSCLKETEEYKYTHTSKNTLPKRGRGEKEGIKKRHSERKPCFWCFFCVSSAFLASKKGGDGASW